MPTIDYKENPIKSLATVFFYKENKKEELKKKKLSSITRKLTCFVNDAITRSSVNKVNDWAPNKERQSSSNTLLSLLPIRNE
jgi:hypothetical protein